MKHCSISIFALTACALLLTTSVLAQIEEKIIIALKTDNFELSETAISALASGEAQTIETESGKVIDILRTADGAEIYIDGELLEMDFNKESLQEEHMVTKHVEVICERDEECDENVFVLSGEGIDFDALHEIHNSEEGHKVIIIKKHIETQD